jgi:hypothetical protein
LQTTKFIIKYRVVNNELDWQEAMYGEKDLESNNNRVGQTSPLSAKNRTRDQHAEVKTCRRRKPMFTTTTLVIILFAIVLVPAGYLVLKRTSQPTNDECIDAFELQTNGAVVKGTFEGATSDPGGAYCGGSSDPADLQRNLVVWYKFRGTGSTIRISATTSFTIFAGSCEDLWNPLDGNVFGNDSLECGSAFGNYALKTVEGTMYYLYMAACPCDHCTVEEFTVSVEEVQGPSNDICESAIELPSDGTPLMVSLQDATADADGVMRSWWKDHGYCNLPPSGVWYYTEKDLSEIKILQMASDDVEINVFKGDSCDTLRPEDEHALQDHRSVKLDPSSKHYYIYISNRYRSLNQVAPDFLISHVPIR